jgi:gas vesicle protein
LGFFWRWAIRDPEFHGTVQLSTRSAHCGPKINGMRDQQPNIKSLGGPSDGADGSAGPEDPVSDKGSGLVTLLVGFGIGVGLALLFAPQSGEETREWISANAEDQFHQFRRRGRRLVFEAQDLLDRGEDSVNRALRSGKNVLESVADKLQ